MAELKTQMNNQSVDAFLSTVDDEAKRNDCYTILKLMEELTGEKPKMWGDVIVGFGLYHYKYKSGREGDWFTTGFSPRKQNITIYIPLAYEGFDELLEKLGKFKRSVSCLYIKRVSDVNLDILKDIIKLNIENLKTMNQI